MDSSQTRLVKMSELKIEDKQKLLFCIDMAIKHAKNSLQVAADLLPLAQKLSSNQNKDVLDGNDDDK